MLRACAGLLSQLERMREALEAQREAHAKLQTGIKGAAPQIQLDPEVPRPPPP